MGMMQTRSIDLHPQLAIKLRSGLVLTHPHARWHIDILMQAGIPEDQWDEVVSASGFLDAHGAFVAGRGVRLLEGSEYFTVPEEDPPADQSMEGTGELFVQSE